MALRIPGTALMRELIELIQAVEAAGFDGARILDSQLLCRDPFVTMALASFGRVGTAEHCAQRIVEMTSAGVTNLSVPAVWEP